VPTTPSSLAPARSRARGGGPPDPEPGAGGAPRPWRLLVLACLALAAVSLLGPSQPTYDPWSWLIWGREIAHLDLVTTSGPSWKPLPVLFTTPFSLLGDAAAPLLWLVVARAGMLLALAFAFRLAARLAGPAAGAIAVVGLLLADRFVSFSARGNSEGLLVALVLWAVERHLDGRRRDALLLGVAAGLLRPEVWALLALYGAWMLLAERRGGVPWRTLALLAGGAVLLALLWFVPEKLGSGDVLRAASRAREPVAASPAQAAHPFLAVFANGSSALAVPFYAGALFAVVHAARRRAAVPLGLAAMAALLMAIVGCLAQIGFTGNLRYVLLPAAVVCVLAGVGWVELVRAVRRRAVVAALLAVSAPFLVLGVVRLADQLDGVRAEAALEGDLPAMIALGGGEAGVRGCGQVFTDPFQTSVVAWHLHVHQGQLGIVPVRRGTTIAPRGTPLGLDPGFPLVAKSRRWLLASSCAR
jgi:hypothetical protein